VGLLALEAFALSAAWAEDCSLPPRPGEAESALREALHGQRPEHVLDHEAVFTDSGLRIHQGDWVGAEFESRGILEVRAGDEVTIYGPSGNVLSGKVAKVQPRAGYDDEGELVLADGTKIPFPPEKNTRMSVSHSAPAAPKGPLAAEAPSAPTHEHDVYFRTAPGESSPHLVEVDLEGGKNVELEVGKRIRIRYTRRVNGEPPREYTEDLVVKRIVQDSNDKTQGKITLYDPDSGSMMPLPIENSSFKMEWKGATFHIQDIQPLGN
jgi:hypothetical protein